MARRALDLSPDIHENIRSLCAAADSLAASGEYPLSLAKYRKALAMVPEPKSEWEASTWIFAAMGDACFQSGDFACAKESLEQAVRCPNGLGNAFIHLRFGQVLFEMNESGKAAEELMRAYMSAGDAIFEGEDEKYFDFLKSRAII